MASRRGAQMFLSRLARSASSLASVSIARASAPRTAAVAAAAAASAVVLYDQLQQQQKAHSLAGHTTLVMSGDCGGTNTRLMVFRVPSGVKASLGKVPEHELVFAKKCVPPAPPHWPPHARVRTSLAPTASQVPQLVVRFLRAGVQGLP